MTITTYELRPDTRPSQLKTVTVPATARKQAVFQLVDGDGAPEQLNQDQHEAGTAQPDYSPEPSLSDVTAKVQLIAIDHLADGSVLFCIDGSIDDPDTGLVSFVLLPQHTRCPGIYHAEVGLFAGDYLVKTWPVRIIVEPSAFASRSSHTLTIPEIRMAVMDLQRDEDDQLLDDLEFTDEDIANAARRVINLWNESPPQVMPFTHRNFPYREMWLIGTLSYLYDAGSARYSRNRLDYSAGGIRIDDKNKAAEYQARSESYRKRFSDWMMQIKYAYNMRVTWGTGI